MMKSNKKISKEKQSQFILTLQTCNLGYQIKNISPEKTMKFNPEKIK